MGGIFGYIKKKEIAGQRRDYFLLGQEHSMPVESQK